MKDRKTVICILGPTATGKTSLALALSEHMPVEVISVDSAMVYAGLDVGTAKPSPDELSRVPHHLVGMLAPTEVYSAADFRKDARRLIEEVLSRGKTPLLVGGTMLYFNALFFGLDQLPGASVEVRSQIQAKANENGWLSLHEELAAVDPLSARRIHPNDKQRVQRALEVFLLTGVRLSEMQEKALAGGQYLSCLFSEFDLRIFSLELADRRELYRRIDLRFKSMLEQGLVEETVQLRQNYHLCASMPSMRAIGYRQVCAYLEGEYDYDAMICRAQAASRQLAKRQITWLRGWRKRNCLPIQSLESGAEGLCEFIQDDLGLN